MALQRIRIGIVGAGSMGKNHARVLASLPDVELAGVFDNHSGRARDVAKAHQARCMGSLDELLPLIDAAAVATPTVTHLEVGLRLLEAGKHVFIEKPITDTAESARQLIEKASASGLILQVGHVERFNPVIGQLEKLLTYPRFIEAHRLSPFPGRSTDIGVVLDLMIHDLEIILHLVKSELESIDAVGVQVLTKREDIANARLRFKNGCVANITTSRISPEKMRKIRVFQDDAYLSLDYQNQSGEIYRKGGLFGISREAVKIEKEEPLKLELAAFAECARHGRQPKVGGQEAAAALELALEITTLIEAGGGYRPVDRQGDSELFCDRERGQVQAPEVHSPSGEPDHLSEAQRHLGRDGRNDPAEQGVAATARVSRIRSDFRDLVAWARSREVLLTSEFFATLSLLDSGHEHFVFRDTVAKRVVKVTYAGKAGSDPLEPPLPSEYLERLRLQNLVFEDDVRLEGIIENRAGVSIVTSQPFVPYGKPPHPTEREIETFLNGLGFFYQSGAYFRKRDRLVLVDPHPANVIRAPDGKLVPIDVQLRILPALPM